MPPYQVCLVDEYFMLIHKAPDHKPVYFLLTVINKVLVILQIQCELSKYEPYLASCYRVSNKLESRVRCV